MLLRRKRKREKDENEGQEEEEEKTKEEESPLELHLTPLHGIAQMRPSYEYLGEMKSILSKNITISAMFMLTYVACHKSCFRLTAQ